MKKKVACILTTLFCTNVPAQTNVETAETASIHKAIDNTFDAMRNHNGKKFLAQFTQQAILERANINNEIETLSLNKFSEFINSTKKHLDEQTFDIKINISGNLASAWVPFVFYLDGRLSHCGVNSFQLIKQQEQWKVRYLIDNGYVGDCEVFIEQHK
ncbi:MAG: hypothetical protein HRT53_21375 [Colwellia sp.]|nr:hypothetical protein [Colwellia sp.]